MTTNRQLTHKQSTSPLKKFPLCILANDIEIAGNVGSLFRIAEAFGVEELHLTGTTAIPPKYKIRKASRSADQRIPYTQSPSAIEVATRLKSNNYLIISLEISSQSQDIRSFKMPHSQPICLIIGSENAGIQQELLDISDHTLHIPMYGENSSMNVATSCAIAVYELIQVFKDD